MSCGCILCLSNNKVRASIMAAVLFAVVASPQLFSLMQSLLGGLFRVASSAGTPTLAGLILHAVVYGLLSFGLMHLKRGKYNRYEGYKCEQHKAM